MQRRLFVLFSALIAGIPCATAQPVSGTMAFTVSMPQPANHTFHVMFRATALHGELQDFKMPVWSPGYYGVGDYARNVMNFRVEDGAGHALPWERVAKNTWRVAAGGASEIVLNYDVFGATSFAANNYLGEDRAYLSPSGTFVHILGMTQHPVTVAIQLPGNWKQIATGLEPVAGEANTFSATDFDVLYDSPILMGNQEYLHFEVKGVPHYVSMENVADTVDRPKMLADLQKMVTAATQLIGDVPYRHYTFLMMGRGNGGIEHLNSASIQFDGNSLSRPFGYLVWLSYVCHEYFHNFNVKRIRPIALGPFNYDLENLTNMLWVSEGLSVYYEDLVLVRAGLMTREQYLYKMQNSIGTFENAAGHHYQSATESSWNTWNAGSGVGGDHNTSISYYNNGAMLGAMLDLKIRDGSKNRKSLDDVMRGLYQKYYLQKHRGFTDAEFRQECEIAAGGDVSEALEYAATTKDVDYAKYFDLAGLRLDVASEDATGSYLGVNMHSQEALPNAAPSGAGRGGRGASPEVTLIITSVTPGSPAATAGLLAGDQILEVEGVKATPKAINDLLAVSPPPVAGRGQVTPPAAQPAVVPKKPGEKLHLRISRNGKPLDVDVELAKNVKRTFSFGFRVADVPTQLQSSILKDWLRSAQ
jgi:predicted metalloprotease with PDZ domain